MISKEIVAITGAGSGLGEALAKQYSENGNHVCLLGRTETKLMNTASQLKGSSSIYELDVTDKSSVHQVIKEVLKNLGSIDCWINNAGVGIFKSTIELTEDDVHQMIGTNLKGTIFCTQEILPVMKRQTKGSIINIVSNSGKIANEIETVYSASKFGVRGFTEALVKECKDMNINIVSAYMGNMKTDLWRTTPPSEQTNNYTDVDKVAKLILESSKQKKDMREENTTIINHNIE